MPRSCATFCSSRFRDITLVTFERLVFDGILQEVVLFCGVVGMRGPARMRTRRAPRCATTRPGRIVERRAFRASPGAAARKREVDQVLPGPRRDPTAAHAQAVRRPGPARRVADVDVGIVTGRNSFFTFTDAQATSSGCWHTASRWSRAAHNCQRPGLRHRLPGQRSSPPTTAPGCSMPPPPADRSRSRRTHQRPARPPACTPATNARSASRGGAHRRSGFPTCSCCARSTWRRA